MNQRIFFAGIFFVSLQVHSQTIQKGTFIVSGAVGVLKPSTFSSDYGDYNNHPFMLNLKAGYFVKRGIALGIEFQSTTYTEPESGVGALQPPGSTNTQSGIIKDKFTSVGVYCDFYKQVSKKIFFIPGIYAHYLNEKFTDRGEYYTNGVPAGILYIKSRDLGYFARVGVNLTLLCFLKPNVSLTLRWAEFDFRLRRRTNDTYIAAPLMLGIQYHFKPKK